jgi:hypothetical protein
VLRNAAPCHQFHKVICQVSFYPVLSCGYYCIFRFRVPISRGRECRRYLPNYEKEAAAAELFPKYADAVARAASLDAW